MKLSRTLINIMVVLGLIMVSVEGWASCSLWQGRRYDLTASLSSVSLATAKNKAPDIPIASVSSSTPTMVNPQCNNGAAKFYANYKNPMVESVYSGIYETAVPGIGVKVFIHARDSNTNLLTISNEKQPFTPVHSGTVTEHLVIEFYVIGPVSPTIGNDTVTLDSPLVELFVNDAGGASDLNFGNLYISGTTQPVTVLSCKTPNVTVPLGSHSASDFATVGATSAPVAFNIVVNECSKNMASVSYTLKPAAGISLVTKPFGQYLTLDSSSVASGVGVQVLKADGVTPVEFEHKYAATGYDKTNGGGFDIPLHARYIRTGTVSAGSANSAAEFVMSYE